MTLRSYFGISLEFGLTFQFHKLDKEILPLFETRWTKEGGLMPEAESRLTTPDRDDGILDLQIHSCAIPSNSPQSQTPSHFPSNQLTHSQTFFLNK